MRQQKKNGFLTFICSLLPGAAEMYMGFMKNGVSLMALFFASCCMNSFMQRTAIFTFISVLIWFLAFFHARNLATSNDVYFGNLTDRYIWEELTDENTKIASSKGKKWIAGILIGFGILLLWDEVSGLLYTMIPDYLWDSTVPFIQAIPQVAVAIIVILIGIRLIIGKKEELNKNGK